MEEYIKECYNQLSGNVKVGPGIMMGYVKVHQSMESYVKPIMYGIIKYVRYLMVFQAVSFGVSQVMSNYARVVLRFIIEFYGYFVYQDMLEYVRV